MSSYPLPDGVVLRTAGEADAPALAALMNAAEEPLGGDNASSAADVLHYWSRSKGLKTWLAERDGRLVGSLETFANDEGRLNADIYIHPELRGSGVDLTLLRMSEDDARERGLRRIMNGILEADTTAAALLEREGYEPVRHFYRMTIELTDETPEPTGPKVSRCSRSTSSATATRCTPSSKRRSRTSGGMFPRRTRSGTRARRNAGATRRSSGLSCATGTRSRR